MSRALETLLSILGLETLEVNLFRGVSPQAGWQRVFGGQVIGQALVAAYRTVEGRTAHSLHGYFLRAGDPSVPMYCRSVIHPLSQLDVAEAIQLSASGSCMPLRKALWPTGAAPAVQSRKTAMI